MRGRAAARVSQTSFHFNIPLLAELDARLIASIILLQPLWVIYGLQPKAVPINHSYTPGCYIS